MVIRSSSGSSRGSSRYRRFIRIPPSFAGCVSQGVTGGRGRSPQDIIADREKAKFTPEQIKNREKFLESVAEARRLVKQQSKGRPLTKSQLEFIARAKRGEIPLSEAEKAELTQFEQLAKKRGIDVQELGQELKKGQKTRETLRKETTAQREIREKIAQREADKFKQKGLEEAKAPLTTRLTAEQKKQGDDIVFRQVEADIKEGIPERPEFEIKERRIEQPPREIKEVPQRTRLQRAKEFIEVGAARIVSKGESQSLQELQTKSQFKRFKDDPVLRSFSEALLFAFPVGVGFGLAAKGLKIAKIGKVVSKLPKVVKVVGKGALPVAFAGTAAGEVTFAPTAAAKKRVIVETAGELVGFTAGFKAVGGAGKLITATKTMIKTFKFEQGIKRTFKDIMLKGTEFKPAVLESTPKGETQLSLTGQPVSEGKLAEARKELGRFIIVQPKPIRSGGKIVGFSEGLEVSSLKPYRVIGLEKGQKTLQGAKRQRVIAFDVAQRKIIEVREPLPRDEGRFRLITTPRKTFKPSISKRALKQTELDILGSTKPQTSSAVELARIEKAISGRISKVPKAAKPLKIEKVDMAKPPKTKAPTGEITSISKADRQFLQSIAEPQEAPLKDFLGAKSMFAEPSIIKVPTTRIRQPRVTPTTTAKGLSVFLASVSSQQKGFDLLSGTVQVVSPIQKIKQAQDLFRLTVQERRIATKSIQAQTRIFRQGKVVSPIAAQDQITAQLLAPTSIAATPVLTGITAAKVKPITKPVPTPTPFFDLEIEKIAKPITKGKGKFDTFVKEKGKYKKVNIKPHTRRSAEGFGMYVADNTPSKSFFIKPSTAKGKASRDFEGRRTSLQGKFRQKKRKGQPIAPIGRPYIEKDRFGIDTVGEIQGISIKGLLAQRRKGRKTTKSIKKALGTAKKKRRKKK